MSKELDNNFKYHKPEGNQEKRYVLLRERGKLLAERIEMMCPASRERSLAITNLEQAIMWANAAIARNEEPVGDE